MKSAKQTTNKRENYSPTNLKNKSMKYLPAFIGIIALSATILVWYLLQINDNERVSNVVQVNASNLGNNIETQIKNHARALERMAQRWSMRRGTPRPEWTSDANRYVTDFEGYQAVEWIDETGYSRWVMPEIGNEKALNFNLLSETNRRAAMEKARDEHITTLSHSVDLVQGEKGFLVFVPLYSGDDFGGYIAGIFKIKNFVESSLPPDTLENYSIELFDNDKPIFQSVLSDKTVEKFTAQDTVNLFGTSWVMRITPNQETVSNLGSTAKNWSLLIGILLSVILAWMVWLAQQARFRALQATNANAVLENEIREREQIQKVLYDTTTFQKALLNGSNYMIIATDTEGTIISFNEAAERNLGYTAEAVVGKTTPGILHDLKEVVERAKELSDETGQKFEPGFEVFVHKSRTERINEREWTYIRKDGSRFPITLSITALKNEEGEITGFLGIGNDITEQKRATEEARVAEERFKTFMNNSPAISYLKDGSGKYLFMNKTMEQVFGKSVNDSEEITDLSFLDDELVQKTREKDAKVITKGEILEYTQEVPSQDGVLRTWQTYKFPVYDGYGNTLVGVIAFDITKQQEAEKALRKSEQYNRDLIEKSPGLISTHTLDGILLSVNPAAAAALGYEPEELVGKSLIEFIPPDRQAVFDEFVEQVETNRGISGTMRVLTKQGEERTWSYTNTVYEKDGKPYVLGHAFDITETKRAEIALRESEERMRLFVENTPAAVAMLDNDMRYVMISKRWLRDYDLEDQDITGLNHYEVFPHIDQARKDIHLRGLKGETIKREEEPSVNEDGTIDWLRWEMYPWHDNSGEIGGVIFFTEVITERKQMQEELARSAAIIESSEDAIISKTLDGIIKTWNRGAEKIFGYQANEVIGQPVSVLYPPESNEEEAAFGGSVEEGKPVKQTETVRIKKDGSRIPVSLTLSPIKDGKGNITGISKIARDITAQKEAEKVLSESERRFRNLLEYSPVGIVLTDQNGGVVFVNDRWSKITGLSVEQAQGEGWASAVHPEDRQEILKDWTEKSRIEEETTYEFRFLTEDGVETEVIARAIKQYDENGIFSGHLATISDINEIKKLQADLKAARDAALESAKMKSEFLANMSHEIRTPMNGVIGMTDLLLSSRLDEEQRENAEIIKSSADGLLTIINDILDFSKIEAGKLSFETIDFDLVHTVESAVEIFSEQASRKNIQIASLIESDISINLRGDPGRLRQILNNLIGNAVKFTENGEVFVRVVKESENDEKCKLRFNISDTGIGIKPKAQDYLFQAFTQADGSMTRKFGGTGLGLAISRQLVEMMKGEIRVESVFGEGSTFSFTAEFEKSESTGINKIVHVKNLQNLRVLIVDDNATNRKILMHQVSSWGLYAEEAENGILGLIKLREAVENDQPFDLAILDLMMPDMNGFELADFIKKDELISDVKLILMPSFGERGHAKTARKKGIEAYLIKPVRQSDLFDCISTLAVDVMTEIKAEDEPPIQLITQHSLKENKRGEQLTILIAEDNVVNQKVAKQQIERLGFRTHIVSNGLEALEVIKHREFSLILMDCQMPVMDGYEATTKIRDFEKGKKRIPVIAMTANAMQGEREKCIEAGMDDYIAKPVKVENLSQVINHWISNSISEQPAISPDKHDDLPQVDEVESLDLTVLETFREFQEADSEDIVTELSNLFINDAGNRLQSLKQAIEEENTEVIKEQAHAIKGSSGSIGAQHLANLCKEVEKNIRNGEKVLDLFESMEKEFEKVVGLLKELMKKSPTSY